MILAQWLTARVEYSYQGRAYPLLFTHRALLLCEHATGIDTLAVNLANPSSSVLRGLLYGALSAAGATCTLDGIGRLFNFRTAPIIREKIIDAWIASMADPAREPYRPKRESSKPPDKVTWIRKWAEDCSRDGLGIPEEKWLDMMPRQIQELQIQRLAQMQREEWLNGIVASQIENWSPLHPKKTTPPYRFMIHELEPQEPESLGDKIAAAFKELPSVGDAGPAPPPEARRPVIEYAKPQEESELVKLDS